MFNIFIFDMIIFVLFKGNINKLWEYIHNLIKSRDFFGYVSANLFNQTTYSQRNQNDTNQVLFIYLFFDGIKCQFAHCVVCMDSPTVHLLFCCRIYLSIPG